MAFNPSTRTDNAWNRFRRERNDRPDPYQSEWEEKAKAMYAEIANRKPYNYDINNDPMYQQYKQQYTAGAQQALSQGNALASGMTGGYGSTSIGAVGQQTNLNYMDRMNDALPQLEQNAYARYQGDKANDMSLYGLTQDNASMDYQRYRDSVGDYQNNRATNYGEYSDSRNFDYAKFGDDRAYKDALAAKAAAEAAARRGGGRGGNGVGYSDQQLRSAIEIYEQRGTASLDNYVEGLIASGMDPQAAYNLRRLIMDNVNYTRNTMDAAQLSPDQQAMLENYKPLNLPSLDRLGR